MKTHPKFTFDDLNSFVDGRLEQLRSDEQQFRTQLLGLNEILQFVTNAARKLSIVNNRLINLRFRQESIEATLNLLQRWLDQWETILCKFESIGDFCGCENSNVFDLSRKTIYELCDKIYTTFLNYYETLELMDFRMTDYENDRVSHPVNILFDILNRNLQLLEKLYVNVQKLQDSINLNGYVINKYRNSCIGY